MAKACAECRVTGQCSTCGKPLRRQRWLPPVGDILHVPTAIFTAGLLAVAVALVHLLPLAVSYVALGVWVLVQIVRAVRARI